MALGVEAGVSVVLMMRPRLGGVEDMLALFVILRAGDTWFATKAWRRR